MSDPYRSNYYGSTYAPQEQYGGAPYPGNGYSQVQLPAFPNVLRTLLIADILFVLSHSRRTSISSSCHSPVTRPDLSPLMLWLHRSPRSPTRATTAAPAHYPLIPTGIITTARVHPPAMSVVLAAPVVTETRAAQRELELLSWEPLGADCWDMRSEAARSGHWEVRWRGQSARMRWRRDMSGRFTLFFPSSLWLFSPPCAIKTRSQSL